MRKRTISIVALILVLMSLPVFAVADIHVHPAQMGDQGGALAAELEMKFQQKNGGANLGLISGYASLSQEKDPRFVTPGSADDPYSADSPSAGSNGNTAAGGYEVDPRFVTPGSADDPYSADTPSSSSGGSAGTEGFVADPRFVVPGSDESGGPAVPEAGGAEGFVADPRFVVPDANGSADGSPQDGESGQSSGGVQTLDWFSGGADLLKNNKNIRIYDTKTGTTWNAKYINGANHADIIPASQSDATLIKNKKITGSYERRPVVVTIAGTQYAGSMYAVGHGATSYCSYFKGVMCIHFTGSKTHGSKKVDAGHQSAIAEALGSGN